MPRKLLSKNLGENVQLEDLDVDRSMVLQWILRKWGAWIWVRCMGSLQDLVKGFC
jgi:hypothetical protein